MASTKRPSIKNYVDFQKTTREYNGKKATAYIPRIKKDTPTTRKINDVSSRLVQDYLNKKVWVPKPSASSRRANAKSNWMVGMVSKKK